MANFEDIFAKISTGAQIVATAEPAIAQFGSDHATATQQLLLIAGSGVAAESNDPQVQSEAAASAQLASSLVPLAFALFSLFHKPKAAAAKA